MAENRRPPPASMYASSSKRAGEAMACSVVGNGKGNGNGRL